MAAPGLVVIHRRPGLPLALLLLAGCTAPATRPSATVDAYGAWLGLPPIEPVPSRFVLRELDGRWWFIAPSGRRFLAVSGATTPAAGRPVTANPDRPIPYLTAGIPIAVDGPIPLAAPGLPDPYDDRSLPGLTDAAATPGAFEDDPFCLGHLAIPGGDIGRVPGGLAASPAASRWREIQVAGGTPADFRDEFVGRLLSLQASALRSADPNHLVFTGWHDPGLTTDGIMNALGRWGDAVCVRIPLSADSVRQAAAAHTATGRPLLVWLADPAAHPGDPPGHLLESTGLDLLALPFVVGLDSLAPPSADAAYRRHAR